MERVIPNATITSSWLFFRHNWKVSLSMLFHSSTRRVYISCWMSRNWNITWNTPRNTKPSNGFFCLVFLLYRLYNGANHYYTNKNLKPILDEFLCFGVLSPFLQRKGENNQTRGDEGKTGGENLRLSEVSYDAWTCYSDMYLKKKIKKKNKKK